MIKFKEFDVGDADYKEQIEQFQAEHQNAEFVQITGGYTSYEKIWFKYEPSDTLATADKLELEKVKKERDSLKEAIEHAIATMAHDGRHDNIPISWILPKLITSLAAIGGDDD